MALKRWLCCVLLVPLLAWAQAYPSKPIRMIVPFPAGGPADIFGRGLAQGMSSELSQPVIIENIGGVGGVLGVDRALKSAPDGYTLGFNSGSTLSIAPYSLAKLPYDVKKDAALITLVVRVPEVLAVNPSLPVSNLAQLVEHARKNPGKVNFGSAGGGSITHLAGELLKSEARIDLVHVPYKGAAPAVSDLVGGQVQMGIFDVPILLGHIRSGKLKALAVTSTARADPARCSDDGGAQLPSRHVGQLVRPGGAGGHACGHPEAPEQRRGGRAAVSRRSRAVRESRRSGLAQHASGVRRIPRQGAGEVEPRGERDRVQGADPVKACLRRRAVSAKSS